MIYCLIFWQEWPNGLGGTWQHWWPPVLRPHCLFIFWYDFSINYVCCHNFQMFSGAWVLKYSMIFDTCSYFILVIKKTTQLSLYSTGNIKSYSYSIYPQLCPYCCTEDLIGTWTCWIQYIAAVLRYGLYLYL
jgi:hypothetical protein